jgi:alpha-beta hydrolase superfamily lysophospholipase
MSNLLAATMLLLASTFALLLWLARRASTRLIHPPHRRAEKSPTDYQLAFENISFTMHDRFTLRGWFIPAPHARGTIILCHGYTGDCSPDLQYAPLFFARGYSTLYFDFRGHGASDGNFTSLVFFERHDLLAAIDFLRARGIERIGLLGFSMGGAIALATAPLSPVVIGVVSDCAFAELQTVIRNDLRRRGVPARIAAGLGWGIVAIASLRLRANLFSADPIHWVSRIAPRPMLMMHAENDAAVPVNEARRMFAAAKEPKALWIVPHAQHRDIEAVARDAYRTRIIEFFDRAFERAN